jgi:hypothetical protein
MALKFSESKALDTGDIVLVEIIPDARLVRVHLRFGYVDVNSGRFVSLAMQTIEIKGANFDSLAQKLTTGKSFYEEIKTAIWEKLIEMGVVSGTME